VSVLQLADGPAMYFGGTIMTFALPYGAFIVIATTLFILYRRPHRGPKLKYLTPETVTSVLTREPGPIPAPAVRASGAAAAGGEPAAPAAPAAAVESDEGDPSAPEGDE
jgi:hypothetical protein